MSLGALMIPPAINISKRRLYKNWRIIIDRSDIHAKKVELVDSFTDSFLITGLTASELVEAINKEGGIENNIPFNYKVNYVICDRCQGYGVLYWTEQATGKKGRAFDIPKYIVDYNKKTIKEKNIYYNIPLIRKTKGEVICNKCRGTGLHAFKGVL